MWMNESVCGFFKESLAGQGSLGQDFIGSGRASRSLAIALVFAGFCALASGEAVAEGPRSEALPRLQTNEAYIDAVTARSNLDIEDVSAVFDHVFSRLPDSVKVYPTENYYYFKFPHNGVVYSGNFRLDAGERDKGKVSFAYFESFTDWRRDEIDRYKVFDATDGVTVTKVAPLVYTIAHAGKTVRFELNDLSNVTPPEGTLGDDERYIGPVFDESGVEFYLVYNGTIKDFLYILNERQTVPDELYPSTGSKRILIGRRTGFAFYRDDRIDRKILVGVQSHNVEINSYLDGPFDQLPDNFIKGDTLKDAILETDPSYKGQIDRFGILPGGDERYLIAPYMSWTYTDELLAASDCASDPDVAEDEYYNCFVFIDENEAPENEAPESGDLEGVNGDVADPGMADAERMVDPDAPPEDGAPAENTGTSQDTAPTQSPARDVMPRAEDKL